jgi:hypothetical protein
MMRQDRTTEARAFRDNGVIAGRLIVAVLLGALLAASCGGVSEDPPQPSRYGS